MADGEAVVDRQRVAQWIEESQYVIGRLIPGLLEDCERQRAKAAAADQDCERLRSEIGELRKEIGEVQSEREFLRNERVATGDALSRAVEHTSQIHHLLGEVLRRHQLTEPTPFTSAPA